MKTSLVETATTVLEPTVDGAKNLPGVFVAPADDFAAKSVSEQA
jgi:hypothetical protein